MIAGVWLLPAVGAVELEVRELGTGRLLQDVAVQDPANQGAWTPPERGPWELPVPAGTVVRILTQEHEPVELPVPAEGPWRVYLRPVRGAHEIVVEARRDTPVVAEQRLDRERVLQTPGTHEDPFRLVQSLPGVSQTPEYSPKAGDIAVRGAAPGNNRYSFDGVDLPYLYHYNQYSSVLHTRMLDELTLYPSAFGASWGDALGAVVDTRSRWERPDRLRASLNLNLIMGGVEASAPLSEAWVLRASARRSYLDLLEGDSLQYTVFPAFGDSFLRLEHTAPNGTRVGALLLTASDSYSRYAGEPTLLDPYENTVNPVLDYRQGYQILAVQHSRATAEGSLLGSASVTAYGVEGTLPDASARQDELRFALREDAVRLLGERLSLGLGAELRVERTSFQVATQRAWPEVARESPLLARGVSATEHLDRVRWGAWVEPRWDVGALRVMPGLRLDYDTATGDWAADPRLGLRWKQGENLSLRAAVGLWSQYPDAQALVPTLGDPSLPAQRSVQAAAGGSLAIAGRWELGVDGWARWMWNLVEEPVGEAPVGGVLGDAQGVSLSSRYRLRELFFAWLSLDLARSTRTLGEDTWVSDYDQPVALNLVGSWTFAPTWNVGVRYRLSSGLPYTPIEDGVYDATTDTYLPVEGARNSARLPPYQKIDLHVEKRFLLRGVTVTPYLEAWYVPAPNNVMYRVWSYDYDTSAEVRGPGFLPLVGVRGEL